MSHPVAHIIDLFEVGRPELVKRLRDEAWLIWQQTQVPVSVNDVRSVLAEVGYTGDPRILAAAFPIRDWIAYGYTTTNSTKAHQRSVRTFVPRNEDAHHVNV